MYEICLHGRGGQGAVLAASILAQALVDEGEFVVAVPSFGFERRGAPVAAYVRCDTQPLRAMTNIYHPDCVICIDPTVARAVDIFAGMPPGGTLVQATKAALADLSLPPGLAHVGLCDAVGIAREVFRRPITNTVMLAAFARTTGMVSLAALQRALEATEFRDAGRAQNRQAMARGYAETIVHDLVREVRHAPAIA
ncbi:MAG TPA: 2-oxoacid:acceptor oxidoreductase family protein [Acetobacteraceae bacterium]|nr:2-oxoacid:acceptor oxidoreductase family protein [Acetobacteraceae bacterium]